MDWTFSTYAGARKVVSYLVKKSERIRPYEGRRLKLTNDI
jgi:hypothetical protein